MIKILMAMYGITAEQAAARLPAVQFVLTAAIAAPMMAQSLAATAA